MKNRRWILAGIACTFGWPMLGRTQSSPLPVVAYFGGTGATSPIRRVAFFRGLAEHGFVDGKNVRIDNRTVNPDPEKMRAMLQDVLKRNVAVIAVPVSTAAALAAKSETSSIPVVFRIAGDPVAVGLVASLARPGGNVTGITTLGSELSQKRMEMLKEVLPAGSTVAALINPTNANVESDRAQIQLAAKKLGLKLEIFETRTGADIDLAFSSMAKRKIRGLMHTADNHYFQQMKRLVEHSAKYGIPAVYSDRAFCEEGGLMCYGTDISEGYYLAGGYVGRILKGTKPADLPVQQSTKVELVVNLKTARASGFKMSPNLMVRADKVIE